MSGKCTNLLLGIVSCTLREPRAMGVFKWKILCWFWTLCAYIDAFWPVWAGRESSDLNSQAWISVKTFTQLRPGISPEHRENSWSCEMLSKALLPEGAAWSKAGLEITSGRNRGMFPLPSLAGAQLWFFFLPFVGVATYQSRAKIILKYPDWATQFYLTCSDRISSAINDLSLLSCLKGLSVSTFMCTSTWMYVCAQIHRNCEDNIRLGHFRHSPGNQPKGGKRPHNRQFLCTPQHLGSSVFFF